MLQASVGMEDGHGLFGENVERWKETTPCAHEGNPIVVGLVSPNLKSSMRGLARTFTNCSLITAGEYPRRTRNRLKSSRRIFRLSSSLTIARSRSPRPYGRF